MPGHFCPGRVSKQYKYKLNKPKHITFKHDTINIINMKIMRLSAFEYKERV